MRADVNMRSKTKLVEIDLRGASLEDLIEFVFERPASRQWAGSDVWYWKRPYRLRIDPTRQVRLMMDLFLRSRVLRRRFSEGQIEDGFWFLFGPAGREWFRDQLWSRRVPWSLRRACILSIPRLYEGVFLRPVKSMHLMLWDLLTEEYRFDLLPKEWVPEAPRVRRAMLEALSEQLRLPHLEAQESAIHGLGHIGLPGARRSLRAYLRRPRLRSWHRKYAEQALTGKIV